MNWPFKTIKQKSEWPFHSLVVSIAGSVIQAPAEQKNAVAQKQIERCLRMAAKLAAEFGFPPCMFMELAEAQLVREAGADAVAHLEAHKASVVDGIVDAQEASKGLVDDLLASIKNPQGSDEEPN